MRLDNVFHHYSSPWWVQFSWIISNIKVTESKIIPSLLQFGQVGVGDDVDHCSPVQVKLPHDQACPCAFYLLKLANTSD